MPDPLAPLAERITAARLHACLSPEQLAEAVEVDWRTVYRWEAGENAPRRSTLTKISARTGVRQEWLADGEMPMVSVNRVDHSRPNPLGTLGPILPVPDGDSPPTMQERGVDLVASRVVMESYDEAGLQWAIEVRVWLRPEPKRLELKTRVESVSEPETEAADKPEGDS